MTSSVSRLVILVLCLEYAAVAQDHSQAVGDSCNIDKQTGVCTHIKQCQAALNDVLKRRLSVKQICGFENKTPLICCLGITPTTTAGPVATTPRLGTTTTEYMPRVYDYETPPEPECAPLQLDETAEKTGQKAWDKCIEYHEQLVRPCGRSVALLGGLARANNCKHSDDIFSDSSSVLHEKASHVALLGYKPKQGSMVWRCSGTLLSDRFILTAAHCTFGGISRGKSYAMVGSRKGKDNMDAPQIHIMKRIIRHPLYKRGSRYHDIALIMTATQITLDQWTVPACLDVFGGNHSKGIALSWLQSTASIVEKVALNKFTTAQCQQALPSRRGMAFGLESTTQICYGDNSIFSTCQRGTGGPLVIKNPRIDCMFSLVGVTSFAKRCNSKIPGVYTKVAQYVPWIESVVWP